MKYIKNTDNHDIEMPFNFYTYIFPKGVVVEVEDDLADFLEERLPLSFSFGKQLAKEEFIPVEKYKTKSYVVTPERAPELGTEDMRIMPVHAQPTFGADHLPANGQVDSDGVEFYGNGIEVEGGQNG